MYDSLGRTLFASLQTVVLRIKADAATCLRHRNYVVFMRSRFGVLPCICLMAALTWTLPSAQAQELFFTLIEQLIVGNDEDAPAEYLFTFPELVWTESKGYIYVRDRQRTDVRVFDESG